MKSNSLDFASFQPQSSNRKLAPQRRNDLGDGRVRNEPSGPWCASTYVSITATCPDTCRFKDAGCYVQAGGGSWAMQRMDQRARDLQPDALAVMHQEAGLIGDSWKKRVRQDGARGGRDLRLHVGGDVSCKDGATVLAAAVDGWYAKDGGSVWTFTHRWREVPVHRWGGINTLASVETAEEAVEATEAGYIPAMVVERHESERAYRLGSLKVIPCPAQTRGRTCVECRLCVDPVLRKGTVIAFAAHGVQAGTVRQQLSQLRLPV